MAAVGAICHLMKAGDHIVASNNLYGGVPRLFNQIMANFGLEFTYVDTSDPRNVERAIRKNTRYVYIETPTNPLMGLTDIAAVSKIAHKRGCEVVVDNTFMSPYFQQPIKLRRRHRDALDDEVSERPQRRPGRRAGVHDQRSRRRSWPSCRRPRARSCRPSSAGWYCAAPRRSPCA